jgi:hypothetical protein
MFLEAQAAHCFSSTYILKRNGMPIGKYEGRWFSQDQDIHLTGRRSLQFRKVGWLASEFELVTAGDESVVGRCCRSGLFSTSWELVLSIGVGKLWQMSWFGTPYELTHDGTSIARVDRRGPCQRGWIVDGAGTLTDEDLLLVGLAYHIILLRRQSQQSGGAAAAGT